MATRAIVIIIEGPTGRLGHDIASALADGDPRRGRAALGGGDRLVPEPVLLGRDPGKTRRPGGGIWRPRMEH